ncbi:CAF17-like 4Fe-4S cluster assembly/insertion protein YgfZ [Thauera sinica]|uniref:YgfZ/GcvT domain-containing protein n=1 Tax=Thauera sinica TaxID=2665146 RepID=A0ABW1AW76_9RHOO|nr:folate-binding protein YgfZ [Thauera sp. K11]ATE59908.1 folate-binding protein YgfZ [Thauera sp. K11]
MTAWTDHLARQGARPNGAAVAFADAETEARAAAEGTIAVPLLHLGVIRSTGPDSATFLHNLVSNDVLRLAADDAAWNSFNSPKGRMIASFLMWSEAEGHALALSADILPAVLKKLSMYVLRSKVKLADASADTLLIGVSGAGAITALRAAGLPVPDAAMKQASDAEGSRCMRIGDAMFVVAAPAGSAPRLFDALAAGGAAKAGTAAWQLAMIRAGIPLVTAATQEEFVAQMLNYELIGGVSFQKGCYPGQEIVARTQYLGKLKKRMYRLAIPGDAAPAPNADLFAPDFGAQSAGKLVNVAPAPGGGFEALAVLQTSSAEAGEVHLGSPDGARLTLLGMPYPLA